MNKKTSRLMWHLQRTGVTDMKYTCPCCGHTEEITTDKKPKPTGQERNMFEAFRVAYKGKKRGLDTELNNLMKHKDWINIIGILYQDKDKYFKGEDVRYIPHLQTFINQRRWEMFADEPVKQTNPYGQQHNWRTS